MTTKTQKAGKKTAKKNSTKVAFVKSKVRQSASEPRKKTSARRKFEKTAVVDVIVVQKVVGLKGQGLLQVGQVKKLELRDRLGMARQMFGRMVNVAERTIAKVESGNDSADKLIRPYNEVYRLWQALRELVDPESLGLWFQTPNESFDGMKPLEIIERGEMDRLWDMVFELQTGMPG